MDSIIWSAKTVVSFFVLEFLTIAGFTMPKITDYFKQAKNIPDQQDDQSVSSFEKGTVAKQFYEKCLTIEHKSCDKIECIEIIAALKNDLKTIQAKCFNIREAIEICSEIVADKDIEINNLMQQLTIAAASAPLTVDVPAGAHDDPVDTEPAMIFSAFQNKFNGDALCSLRSVDSRSEKDLHFVNVAMKSLYAGRLNVLKISPLPGVVNPAIPKKQ